MKVFSNLAISLDGKIADLAAPAKSLGTSFDRKTMQVIRRKADVIVVGAGTLRVHPYAYTVKGLKKGERQVANAIVTASGDLDAESGFWDDAGVVRFVFTTRRGFAKAQAAARERAFVIEAGEHEVDLSLVLKRLARSGLENILVEGGGELMAAFLEQGLLHELFVTLTPWILGGRKNPTLVGGDATLSPWRGLSLLSSRRVKQEIYLHYAVKGARRRV